MVRRHKVSEGCDDFPGEKVEDESEKDGYGEGGQRFPERGQAHERQAEADEDGHEASHRRVPVAVGRGFAYQDGVEDEVSQAQFDAPVLLLGRGHHQRLSLLFPPAPLLMLLRRTWLPPAVAGRSGGGRRRLVVV